MNNNQPKNDQISPPIEVNSSNIQSNSSYSVLEKVLIGLPFFLIVCVLAGAGFYFFYWQKQTNNSKLSQLTHENNKIENNSNIVQTPLNTNENNIIGYIANEYKDLRFYDIDQNKELPKIQELENSFPIKQLGPWSPNGKYLPVLAIETADQNRETLFLYDSSNHTVKKIYVNDGTKTQMFDSFTHSTWIDNERFVVKKELSPTGVISGLTYITTNGSIQEVNSPSIILQEKNDVLSYDLDVSNGKNERKNIVVKNKTIDLSPQGLIVGVVNNDLISLVKPPLNSPVNNPELDKKMKEFENQGLSESELQTQLLKLIQPTSDTLLYLTDVNSKESKTVKLNEESWQVQSIQTHPTEPLIIIHQKDRDIAPTRERYISLNPYNSQKKILYESAIVQMNESTPLLTEGITFHITQNGKWLIVYDSSKNVLFGSVHAINIKTGEKLTVCSENCMNMKVYNPTQLVLSYKT